MADMDQNFMVTQREVQSTEERRGGGGVGWGRGACLRQRVVWFWLSGKPHVPGVSCCRVWGGGGASSAAGGAAEKSFNPHSVDLRSYGNRIDSQRAAAASDRRSHSKKSGSGVEGWKG